ncbi:hypothetical protein SynBIOSU31_02122 [Synechococcus sp. BIOS-U3-1]|nr:hypothetical protein SynBIOSU31_02122 [Synechococcus sp. BIOS-U3-1]
MDRPSKDKTRHSSHRQKLSCSRRRLMNKPDDDATQIRRAVVLFNVQQRNALKLCSVKSFSA